MEEAKKVAYCVKCRKKSEMADGAESVQMPSKGGGTHPAIKGKCAVCGTGMFMILPRKKPDASQEG